MKKIFFDNFMQNQAFIDKIEITICSAVIPININVSQTIKTLPGTYKVFFVSTSILAFCVIFFQIIGALYGKKSCELYKNKQLSEKFNTKQNICNTLSNICFFVMLVAYLAVTIGLTF